MLLLFWQLDGVGLRKAGVTIKMMVYYGGRGFPRQTLEAEGGRGQPYAHYTPHFNSVNGYRRTDNNNSNNSSGWNGPRPARRGAGNQGAAHGRGSVPPE